MKSSFPEAKSPLEYVAFFHFEVRTKEGPGQVFIAVDPFRDFAYSLGVERNISPDSVLKNIYFLLEDPDFVLHNSKGFTLVMAEHQELESRINAIIEPAGGKVMFNKVFNHYLAKPVLESIRDSMMKGRSF